ncbi:unnamed protein product [Lactuca virosa]|uniref:P-type ATPase N-terminal domain-containing protein n=1 Tax=Lactuca virosa TaxID=75947 RepID=A0AAU9LEG2_9ASTR|nr:unnamed protein product [Lactuca virosa]
MSRVVFCNASGRHTVKPYKYASNVVSTTKYNVAIFLPKLLFEQFRRVANLYFLLVAMLSLTLFTPFYPLSLIAPLVFVMGVSLVKEGVEDWRRLLKDQEINSRTVKIAPLVFVVRVSLVKDGVEDWCRLLKDRDVNSRTVKVLTGNEISFADKHWKALRVGDVIKVDKKDYFPVDLMSLCSNYQDGVCYVEKINLDKETNLKDKT